MTSVIIMSLIFSGPTRALDLSLSTDKESYGVGEPVEVVMDIDIEVDELVPFTDAKVEIYGTESYNSMFTSECILDNLDEGTHLECTTQDPRFQEVKLEYIDVENLIGNRTAEFNSTYYEWGYGYGYGYGEAVTGQIVLRITWELPSDWSSGKYQTKVTIGTEEDIFRIRREFPVTENFEVRNIDGKIAYLCRDSSCDYGIESDMIDWLMAKGWDVDGKPSGEWTEDELEFYDLMVCSDELIACKVDNYPDVYNSHKNGIPFVEIGDYFYLSAAYRFDYINRYFGSLTEGHLYVTEDDPVTDGYSGMVNVLSDENKMFVMDDIYLGPEVIDLADVSNDKGDTTLFKVDDTEGHGRYAYSGWFYKSDIEDLTGDGDEILVRLINWVQCEKTLGCGRSNIDPDLTSPIAFNGQPKGLQEFSTVELMVETNEAATCRGSIDVDEDYEDMNFMFSGSRLTHNYIYKDLLDNGNHTVYVRCEDKYGNVADTSYSWTFEVDVGIPKKIAYLCRDDDCDYGIEDEMITWLQDEEWEVEGKKYDDWSAIEFEHSGLILCSDELVACKVEPGSLIYEYHKLHGKPFLEVGDFNYLSAAYRFGYVDNYFGQFKRGQLYITQSDPVTDGLTGDVNVLASNPKMSLIQDYLLSLEVVDIADVDVDNSRSTLFRLDDADGQGRYAYVGWFYNSYPSDLTVEGRMILTRLLNWAVCNDANGC